MTDEPTTTPESGDHSGQHPSGSGPDSRQSRSRSPLAVLLGWAKELVVIAVIALVISSLIRAFLGQVFVIPSGSMENTLQVSDRVVVSKVTHFKRGDVVVFKDPGGWLPAADPSTGWRRGLEFVGVLPNSSSQYLIKRVIGVAGDTVTYTTGGKLTVNGRPLEEASYLYSDAQGQVAPAEVPFEVVVPAGTVFVMGDHRNDSFDSRCHLADITNDGRPRGASAFVPVGDVVGPAVQIVAPLDRFHQLKRPATFASVPAGAAPPAQAKIVPEGVGCQ
ncbi:signal peptidase I [Aestuariimicrobium sp. T2.26MG-19.2B]|uniref:signal peptidase I n=1 Tax=Aestuariimicrobium sp. T2.26MG-19.2B TaxID=3040679 RepID=UPI0024775EDA|nr:signal peptidase I [Aestuariimicrobium sp. T2.26MG-19.2B]CAI9398675.1 Signal peptidase I [Aestuariimicrobium sp. T2.26MG-19.2B]